jgi:hypothetical protein
MGLCTFKFVSLSGLALVILNVVGCGGGSSSTNGAQVASTVTQGSTNCSAITNPALLTSSFESVIGSCNQYVASSTPTSTLTAFKNPGTSQPVFFSPAFGYQISLPVLTSTKSAVPLSNILTLPGGVAAYSFGSLAGSSYQTILDSNTGSAAVVHDFKNTTTVSRQKILDLNFSRFGLFSQFDSRTVGYFGGWAQGDILGNLPPGSVQFRGAVVGVLGPSSSGSSLQNSVSYSAEVTLVVNFAAPGAPITSLSLSNFGYAANDVGIAKQIVAPGGVVSTSSLDPSSKSLSALFTTVSAGAGSAIVEGQLAGSFHGNNGVDVSEFVGTIKFRTADGLNAVGAFGVRSGASIINPTP